MLFEGFTVFGMRLQNRDYMTICLSILVLLGATQLGIEKTIPQAILSVAVAAGLDVAFNFYKLKRFELPRSAAITGLIVSLALPAGTDLPILFLADIAAIASKHFIKFEDSHIFNPANTGALATVLAFGTYYAWWSLSMPKELIWFGVPIPVLLLGLFVSHRVRRLRIVATYFVVYGGLLSWYAFSTGVNPLTYLLSINLFFTLFMLIEPMTSARGPKKMVAYGAIAGIASFAVFAYVQALAPFLEAVTLIVANASVLLLDRVIQEQNVPS